MTTDDGKVYILDLAIHTVKQPDGRRQIYTFDGKGGSLGQLSRESYSPLWVTISSFIRMFFVSYY